MCIINSWRCKMENIESVLKFVETGVAIMKKGRSKKLSEFDEFKEGKISAYREIQRFIETGY